MEHPADVMARLTGVQSCPAQETQQVITTAFGQPLPSVTHALQVHGRPVSSDVHLFEKQQTFNRAKTLERMVHPAGAGAFGYFEVTQDLQSYCKASFLNDLGKQTPVFVRFSTVTFGREFPDSARNPRGFAIKFYTEDGNYDIVGLNWPIFFVRDPMKGPDVIRSQQRDPTNFLLNFEATFDFLAANPEALHAGTMFFSDSATPVGFRHMDGFGCHTFKWVNAQNEFVYVKYHFVPEGGKKNFTIEEAELMSGVDPDFAKRDLFEHLAAGEEARWRAYVQIMTPEQAENCAYDPFDVTKVWSHHDFPLHEVGVLVLNQNPENYHRDVEQAAFSPGNLVAGIEPSSDLLLNWRMFFYRDAQYHRLGVNHHEIPVNCPFMARFFSPQSRDGVMRTDRNGVGLCPHAAAGKDKRQETSTQSEWLPVKLDKSNAEITRGPSSRHEGQESEYDQVRELYCNVMDDEGRDHLHKNTAKCLRFCSVVTQQAYLGQLQLIDDAYHTGVVQWMKKLETAPTASDLYRKVKGLAKEQDPVTMP